MQKEIIIQKRDTIALFLLLVASTFQYGDYILSRYFIPLVITILVSVYFLCSKKNLDSFQKKILILHCSTFSFFLLLSILGTGDLKDFTFDFVKLFLAFAISFLSFYYISLNKQNTIYRLLKIMLYFAIFFLSLELIMRWQSFNYDFSLAKKDFYILKINSPFMVDSNAVGLYILFYFLIALYLFLSKNNKFKKQTFVQICFLCFFSMTTISRSLIITLLFLGLFLVFIKLSQKSKLFIPILGLVIVILFFYILKFTSYDGSGSTKIEIITRTFEIAKTLNARELLFGFGIEKGNWIYSYRDGAYAHLLFPMILGNFGLFGILIYITFFTFTSYFSKAYNTLFNLAIFVIGLSYLPPFLESLFLVNGVLLGLYYHRRSEIQTA